MAFLTKPYLQNPAATEMTVRWITSVPGCSWIEYGETEALGQKAKPIVEGMVRNYLRVNSVTLRGLKPGTLYHYRIASQPIAGDRPFRLNLGAVVTGDTYRFTTFREQADEVAVLVYNDLHNRPESIPHLFGLTGGFQPDFVFFNGDVFDKQITGEADVIRNLLVPCGETFATSTPFIMTRGNHDTYGKFATHLFSYVTHRQEKFFSTFRLGPVQFVILDTGDAAPDNEFTSFDAYRAEQARWLEQEMQSPAFQAAPFRVVLMHIPHFHTNNDFHATRHCRELYAKLFNDGRVDLTLSGHTHTLGLHLPEAGKHDYPVVIGGGPNNGNRTITKLQADRRELSLTMIRDDGKEVIRHVVAARPSRA